MHPHYPSQTLLLFLLTGLIALAQGCKEYPYVSEPVQFVFPSDVGTTWTYRHTGSFSHANQWTVSATSGVHVWQVLSATTLSDSSVLVLRCLQLDTTHFVYFVPDHPIDSTYCTAIDTSFFVIIRPSQIEARWPETMSMPKWIGNMAYTPMPVLLMSQVPRFIARSSDTIQVSDGRYVARYLSGFGLIRYSGNGSAGDFSLFEDMFFVGMSLK